MKFNTNKISKLEKRFLNKSRIILKRRNVTLDNIIKLNNAFEKMLYSIGKEPIDIYRTTEIMLKGTDYSLNSTFEDNINYMRQILIQENNITFKTILIGTLSKIVTAERVSKEVDSSDEEKE